MKNYRTVLGCACVGVVVLSVPARAATIRFDNGGGTGTWENAANWNNSVGPDGVPDTGDENSDGLPGTADIAEITANNSPNVNGDVTVNISSAQTVSEVVLSNTGGSSSNVPGTATLNVLAGTNLNASASGGARIGRSLGTAALGSATARVIQTGGIFQAAGGSNGIRLSAGDGGNVADSYFRISDGTARGAADATSAALGDLRIGATGSNFLAAEFHVSGSAADEVRFADVQVASSNAQTAASGGANGHAIVHFSLDTGGVTPIIANDEFQFRSGTAGAIPVGLLQVDLIDEAPQADVVLVRADRLGNNGGAQELFSNYVDNDTLVAVGAGWEYTYTIDYTDGSDDGTLNDSIVLHYVSRTLIPEPTSLALLGLGGLALFRRRRA